MGCQPFSNFFDHGQALPISFIQCDQIFLCIEARHTAHPGCGYRLAVDTIHHITGSEHSRHAGPGTLMNLDISLVVKIDLAFENPAVRDMSDCQEKSVSRMLCLLAGFHVFQCHRFHALLLGADNICNHRVPDNLDLIVA